MSLQACADLLSRGDPDRFAAAMARPVAERKLLFPLYALNLEIARAPWVTQETMIAEMRLQWWRDTLEDIAEGKPPRAHEVAAPLADVVTPAMVPALDRMADARRWDIYRDAHADRAAFDAYLSATAGGVPEALCHAQGIDPAPVADWAWASGLARLFLAIPDLQARGRVPLIEGTPQAVRALAQEGLVKLRRGRALPPMVRADGWLAEPILRLAAAEPARVADGTLDISPFRRNWRLLRLSYGML